MSIRRTRPWSKVKKRLKQAVKGTGQSGRFLKVRQDGVSLDKVAIARDEKYDALHGVWTSLEDLSPEQVV